MPGSEFKEGNLRWLQILGRTVSDCLRCRNYTRQNGHDIELRPLSRPETNDEIDIEKDSHKRYTNISTIEAVEEKSHFLSDSFIETQLASLYNLLVESVRRRSFFSSSEAPSITRSVAQQSALINLLVTEGFFAKRSALPRTLTRIVLEYAEGMYGYLLIKGNWESVDWKELAKACLSKNYFTEACVILNNVYSDNIYVYFYSHGVLERARLGEGIFCDDSRIIKGAIQRTEHQNSPWINDRNGCQTKVVFCSVDNFLETQKSIAKQHLIASLRRLDRLVPQSLLYRTMADIKMTQLLSRISEFGKVVAQVLKLDVSCDLHAITREYDEIGDLKAIQSCAIALRSIAACYDRALPEAITLLNSITNRIQEIEATNAFRAEYSKRFAAAKLV